MSLLRLLILALAVGLVVPAAADAAKPKRQFYVSLGDSYAIGFQPSVIHQSGGTFIDVTAASGAYGSFEETTDRLRGYGTIPLPVAKVCEVTYYCEFRDIHARTSGYRRIAELIVKTLPRR